MNNLHYKSVSTVATHVDNLISLGYLEKKNRSARSLHVAGKDTNFAEASVSAAQQKWLVDLIDERFNIVEEDQNSSQKSIDDLFVLVGALHVMGFKDAARSFKPRLMALRQIIDSQGQQ
jgi:DNA topoisomerase IA